MTDTVSVSLPRTAPTSYGHRLALFAIRRMASSGVNDAHAANALLGAFGRRYRRPLILLRAMMLELARTAERKIMVAPCCCARMTTDEAMLIEAMSDALAEPVQAHDKVCELLGTSHALGALTCLQAVAQAFTDLGHPLSLYRG